MIPTTWCHRENILSSKEIKLKQYSNPAMQTSNPFSSMLSVWCSDGSSGSTEHIVSLRLTLLQACNFLLANIPGSWHLQHLWVSLATKAEVHRFHTVTFHSIWAGNTTCQTLPGVLVTFLLLH